MKEPFPFSKDSKKYFLENDISKQSVSIDFQSTANIATIRSILSYCKQWKIRNIYIKLENLIDDNVIKNLNAVLSDTFLFSPDEFQFYLFLDIVENAVLKEVWENNIDTKDFLLSFLIHTADYEVHDRSMGEDIIRIFSYKPECYKITPKKNNLYLKLNYPEHVFAVILDSSNSDKENVSDLVDITDQYNLKTGVLDIPWKNKNEVKVYVIRKILGFSDSTVYQKLNIFSSKIFEIFLIHMEKRLKQYSPIFSGIILSSDSFFPDYHNIIPVDSNFLKVYFDQTEKNYGISMIHALHDKSENSHHYRYDFYSFNHKQLFTSLSNSLITNEQLNSTRLKLFIPEAINPDLNKNTRSQLFDFFSLFDELELPVSAKYLIPDGKLAKKKEVDLKIVSSVSHHLEQKQVTIHCNELLSISDSFEHKLWQFHWLLSCGIVDVNMSVKHSATETKVNLFNDLPSFDPSYSSYRKWFTYINQMSNFAKKGTHKCDILILYPTDSFFCGNVTDISEITATLINLGFDFDFINFEKFIDSKHCIIKDNTLQISNETYPLLIVPGVEAITLDVLRKIYDYYCSGGTVIAIGALPSKSCNWDTDQEIESISNEIWFKKTNLQSTKFKTNKWGGKGFYQNNINLLPEIIEENRKLLNLYIKSSHKNIRTVVRESPDEYYLFFFNISSTDYFKGTIFSKYIGEPFIWNPEKESTDSLFTYSLNEDYLQFSLGIPAKQMKLVILKKGDVKILPKITDTNINKIEKINISRSQITLFGTVTEAGKYSASININNMSKNSEINIKKMLPVLKISNNNWNIQFGDKKFTGSLGDLSHYSSAFHGKISISKVLVISKEYLTGYKLILDLGKVSDSIEIIINQKKIGMILAPPYIIDITNYLSEGDNNFNILIHGHLSNKLSYMSNQENTSPLIKEIGLMGPVKIIPHKKFQLNF